MRTGPRAKPAAYRRAIVALGHAFERVKPGIKLSASGAVKEFLDNTLPGTKAAWFEADLRSGDGRELEAKFLAAHSSSALAVNHFARFKTEQRGLQIADWAGLTPLRFEAKCPTGLRGGRSPNLDLLAESTSAILGIESKCTEHLTQREAKFSLAYEAQIHDERRETAWFDLMQTLRKEPGRYRHLDAAQLVKHAFGLGRCFAGRDTILLYLYWEPRNATAIPELQKHREEVRRFAGEVAGASPRFAVLSYRDLWESWDRLRTPAWLPEHLSDLRARYDIEI